MSKLTIRRFRSSEIEKIGRLQPEGWLDIKIYFKFYLQMAGYMKILSQEWFLVKR